MSLIPEFELGLWSAWIFVLSFFLIAFGLMSLILRVFFNGNKKPAGPSRPDKPPFNEQEKKLYYISQVAIWASNVYSFLLPLKLGTAWFYAGLFVYSVGLIVLIVAEVNFETTPVDRPVTRGVYRISRNPIYLGCFLVYVGIGIACASWLFLLLTMIWIALYDILIAPEERWCLEKYGDAYREYMKRTAKWIGIPKSREK